jgi:ABC-type multidrug transport system permease subunit
MKSQRSLENHQVAVLSDRYLDILLRDPGGTTLLLLQAPLLGAAIAGVWVNLSKDTLTLYFVLTLSAFFLGAVNSSREIVKERALFLREQMFNLSVSAYLKSKFRVQAVLALIQAAALTVVVSSFVPLEINSLLVALVIVLTVFCGTTIGLFISSLVRSSDRAVALVPLVVIPQILFSDIVIGKDRLTNWTGIIQQMMPVHWAYRALENLRSHTIEYGALLIQIIALFLTIAIGFAAALWRLRQLREWDS